jgi:tyrosinase
MARLLYTWLCAVPHLAQAIRDALRGQSYSRRTQTFLICHIRTEQQVLQQHAIAIADTYTVNRAQWQKAAADLRQPYWDWASNSVPPAEVISLQQVNITKPDGSRGPVQNPLFSYRFHPIDGSFPPPYSRWNSTLRQPTGTGSGATSNVSRLTR